MTEQISEHASALDPSTELEFARTRNSFEQTLMSWIRTATSLITFGFSIYKFFQIEAPTAGQHAGLIGPRAFALMLVSIGLASLPLAVLEYRQSIRMLEMQYASKRRSLAVLVAGLISTLGFIALLAMIFRE
jgi:putative membrane protein